MRRPVTSIRSQEAEGRLEVQPSYGASRLAPRELSLLQRSVLTGCGSAVDKLTEIKDQLELSTQTQQEEGWKAGVGGDRGGFSQL